MKQFYALLGLCFLAAPALAQINNQVIDPTASVMDPSGDQPLHHHKHGRFGQELNQLPKEKSNLIRATTERAKAENHPLIDRLRQLHTETIALLQAPTLDMTALRTKQEEERKLRVQILLNNDEAFDSYAPKLSSDERIAVLGSIEPKDGSDKASTDLKKQEPRVPSH